MHCFLIILYISIALKLFTFLFLIQFNQNGETSMELSLRLRFAVIIEIIVSFGIPLILRCYTKITIIIITIHAYFDVLKVYNKQTN